MNIAIITGASSGMGKEFALQISNKYNNLDEIWLIARRTEALEKLSKKISVPTKILGVDLTDENQKLQLVNELEKEKPTIRILVNSAGYGWLANLNTKDVDKFTGMIDLNCKALTWVCAISLPYLKPNSRIINFASSAAFMPQPGFNVYAATKAYVLSFSKALRMELRSRKIYVTAVCPGPVETEFFDIADPDKKTSWYKHLFMAKPDKVVKKALADSKTNKSTSVYGLPMNVFRVLAKIIPHDLILGFYNLSE